MFLVVLLNFSAYFILCLAFITDYWVKVSLVINCWIWAIIVGNYREFISSKWIGKGCIQSWPSLSFQVHPKMSNIEIQALTDQALVAGAKDQALNEVFCFRKRWSTGVSFTVFCWNIVFIMGKNDKSPLFSFLFFYFLFKIKDS